MLKIQLKIWKPGDIIPSERFFAIKFDATRGFIKSIFRSLKINGIVISQPKIGYTVSADWNNFLEIEHHQIVNHVTHLSDKKLTPNLLRLINKCLLEHNFDLKINEFSFQCVKKTYFTDDNEVIKIINLFVPRQLFLKVNLQDLNNSIMYFYGINGWVIAHKIVLRAPGKENIFQTIKLIFDFDHNLLGIYEINRFDQDNTFDLIMEKKIII